MFRNAGFSKKEFTYAQPLSRSSLSDLPVRLFFLFDENWLLALALTFTLVSTCSGRWIPSGIFSCDSLVGDVKMAATLTS